MSNEFFKGTGIHGVNIIPLGRRPGIAVGSASSPSYSPVLDGITSADPLFAWGVYQLSSSVTNCVDIREDGGGTTETIGFVDGYIDTAAIATHIGVNNGYASTHYDASGNARDGAEGTASSQSLYRASGGLSLAAFNAPTGNVYRYTLDSNTGAITTYHCLILIHTVTATGTTNDNILNPFCADGNTVWGQPRMRNDAGDDFELGMSQGSGNDLQSTTVPNDDATTYLVEMTRDGSNNTDYLFDGVSEATGSFSNTNAIAYMMGRLEQTDIEYYEMVAFDDILSSGDKTTYYEHLENDYGLVLP